MITLTISPCGCMQIYNPGLLVIDSPYLPGTDMLVLGITFNETSYEINEIFGVNELLLEYLNTIFVTENDLNGYFGISGESFYYSNPELFNSAEMSIQYGLKIEIFKIGTEGEETTNPKGYTAELDPDNDGILTISHPSLLNLTEISLFIGEGNSQPVATRHTYSQVDPDNDLNGLIAFAELQFNTNIYFTGSQTAS